MLRRQSDSRRRTGTSSIQMYRRYFRRRGTRRLEAGHERRFVQPGRRSSPHREADGPDRPAGAMGKVCCRRSISGKPLERDPSPIEVKRGERARVFEENLLFVRQLWDQDGGVSRPGGGPPVMIYPRPTRPLEVWFGGRSERALQRAGRLSDGWIGNFLMPEEVGAARQTISDAAAAAGRQIEQDHFGTNIYYVRNRRTPFALKHVVEAMAYCGCYMPGPDACPPRFEPGDASAR